MFALAAYQPDIAPNLGAMIRLCACFGAQMHVIEPCGFALTDKALRRAAMDYAKMTPVRRHISWTTFQAEPRAGRLVLLSTKADADLWDFRFEPGDMLMVGRESAGVPDDVHDAADARLRIAMPGGGRSLNVAMAAGMVMAEAWRQCRPPGFSESQGNSAV